MLEKGRPSPLPRAGRDGRAGFFQAYNRTTRDPSVVRASGGFDHARGDRVGADPMRAPLHCQLAGRADNPRLGCGVGEGRVVFETHQGV